MCKDQPHFSYSKGADLASLLQVIKIHAADVCLCLSPKMLHLPLVSPCQKPPPNLTDLSLPSGTPQHSSAPICDLRLCFHHLSILTELKV